jgi:DNA-binding helix-hairpin-helix protein with protein kinase domain
MKIGCTKRGICQMHLSPALAADKRLPSGERIAVNLNAPQVTDEAGVPFALGEILTHASDGAVYRVPTDGQLAAKVFHGEPNPHISARLKGMLQLGNSELRKVTLWPTALLYPKGSDEPVGFLMPLARGRFPISTLSSPKGQSAHFPNADWRFLVRAATNLARAFHAVIKAGCVIGNVNPANILIGSDASVVLTGCDTFQIDATGSVIGAAAQETLLAPELHDKPFGGLVRSVNHDNFALAVLIFQLLFAGRHPFAGRYLGEGDMPISRAIAEFRFPYGARRSTHMMEPPPKTPALLIVGPELAALFERAFGKPAVKGGRPSAREWMAALSRLEQNLKPCRIDSAHWHHAGTSCPWCRVAADRGAAAAFLAEEVPLGDRTDFETLWKEAETLDPPGEAPNILDLESTPSDAALAVRRKGNLAHLAAFVIALGLITMGILTKVEAIHPLWFVFAGIVAFFVTHGLFNTEEDEAAIKRRLERAKFKWEAAEAEWALRASSEEFSRQKTLLQELRDAWDQLPALRSRRHEELKNDHWALQRNRYLDGYRIAEARIEALTTERLAFLASYGIETAADIDIKRFNAVPGLSNRLLESLLAWRTSIERDFMYAPTLPIDPAEIARVEREIQADARQLESQVRIGLASLKQVRRQIEAARRSLKGPTEEAYRYYAQAQIDAAVLS